MSASHGLTLRERAMQLTGKALIDAACAIEEGRTPERDVALDAFHGFAVEGLWTTSYMYQVGELARLRGCTAYNRLERTFLPVPSSWRHPSLPASNYAVRLERDRLVSSKSWPFSQDGMMGDYQSAASPKWMSHGLIHGLVGFGYWPDLSEWEVMAMARLGEAFASLHWYWLAELGRSYCDQHSVLSGDATPPDCPLCRALEADAAHREVRLKRLQSDSARRIADNAVQILQYEAQCYEAAIARGELVVPQQKYLDLGEACDYARAHQRRLASPEHRHFVELFLTPQVDYAPDPVSFSRRCAGVLDALLTPGSPEEKVAGSRAARVIRDLAYRITQLGAEHSEPHIQDILQALKVQLDAAQLANDVSEADQKVAASIDVISTQLNPAETQMVLSLGYQPCMDPAHEPEASLGARASAYVQRLEVSGSPLRYFVPRSASMRESVVIRPRRARLVDEVLDAALAQEATEDVNELLTQGLMGWLKVLADAWGPNDAAPFLERQWYYRLAADAFPESSEWSRYRVRPNPYLTAMPASFDVNWLEKARGEMEAPLKPRQAMRLAYVLVGQGREAPIFLPYTAGRKALLDALQHTPTLEELIQSESFSESRLRTAVNEGLVICLQHDVAYTLYADSPLPASADVTEASAAMPTVPAGPTIDAPAGGPWNDPEQAAYYEAYCERSDLYTELSRSLVSWADPEPNDRVADLGAGTGVSAYALLEVLGEQGRVFGFDPAPLMVEAASRLNQDARAFFSLGTAKQIAEVAETAPFDGILCNSAIWLDRDMSTALNHAASALKPGGWIGISLPSEYLGVVEHRLSESAIRFSETLREVRDRLNAGEISTAELPHLQFLGSEARFKAGLEQAGFHHVELQAWTHWWTVGDYIDWLAQPVLLEAMVSNLKSAKSRSRFLDALKEAADTEAPIASTWHLVRAIRRSP